MLSVIVLALALETCSARVPKTRRAGEAGNGEAVHDSESGYCMWSSALEGESQERE